jgi:hypothetical protein
MILIRTTVNSSPLEPRYFVTNSSLPGMITYLSTVVESNQLAVVGSPGKSRREDNDSTRVWQIEKWLV